MLVSIDLGYGYTKAVSIQKRVTFPSVIAKGNEDSFDFGDDFKHVIKFREGGSIEKEIILIGEAAHKSRVATLSLSRNKFIHKNSAIIALTAAYLVGAERQADLALGLPIAYYNAQKAQLKGFFAGVSGYITVDKGPEKYISFSQVHVFPQGGGALYTIDNLPKQGLVGIVDIGFHTTDYLLLQCTQEKVMPLKEYTSSIEIGVNTAVKRFADKFLKQTGSPIKLSDAHELWVSGMDEITNQLGTINIKDMIASAKSETSQAIAENIMSSWSEKKSLLSKTFLTGGGAEEFNLNDLHAEVMPDARFANALGFYKLASRILAKSAAV